MADLAAWLESLRLGQYTQIFVENDIDLEVLPHLSDDDLKELGLSLGHRRKLIAAISEATSETGRSTQPDQTTATVDDAERRQLTVMFCDLAESTELSQKLDAEELRDVMRRYHETVARIVTGHEGHVAKLLGDGVLAYFGWPHAHEDQVELAIRAGLDAVAAVGGMTAAEAPLAARVGIATGQVVIGDIMGEAAQERGAVAGETPNLAARLQEEAQRGEVVINGATRRLAGGAFLLEDRGAQALKGFVEPVQIWRVRGLARIGSRFDAAHGESLTEFVGRAHEIGLLLDRWSRARQGEGQVVLLSGEAGIGKSRILREFTQRLGEGEARILRYQCSPHEINAAFHPLIAEIEAEAGFEPADTTEARLDRLDCHLAPIFGEDGEARALIAELLGLPADCYPLVEMAPQRRKQRLIALLAERIAGLARGRTLLLLVEDIHWIDPSSLEALDVLVSRVQELPTLAVLTYRLEFTPTWSGYGHITQYSLNRFGRAEGQAIAERITGGKSLPAQVMSRILEQTDGVPLFVEELTKTVLEAGILREEAEHYVLDGPLPALAIPATLQDSLMARLDRLAPVKRVVQAAACIGREFGAGLLREALAMDEEALDDALGQLLKAELIFRRGGAEEARFIFKHALVQDAAYASLLTASRRALHERLASALERSDEPDTLQLARHFDAAGASKKAAELYLQAGMHSLQASALPEAIGALELGLEAVGRIDPSTAGDRLELNIRVALGTARMANFGWAHPSVSEALETAFPLAKGFGERDALGSILWGLWVHYQTRTNFPRAHEWLDELETVAAENADSDLPLIYDMSAGCQYFWEADYPRSLGHTDRLREVYDFDRHSRITSLTNHDPLVFSQHWAGSFADWIAGRPERSIERLDESVALARRIGHPFNLVFALTAGASSLIYLREVERLLRHCDEALEVVTEEALGPFSKHVNVMQWRGAAQVQRGDFEDGYALVKEGNDFWTANGGRICTAMFRSWIVLGLQGLGRIDEALTLNTANIEHCRATGDCFMEPECVRLTGELTLQARPADLQTAEHLFREAIAIAQAHGAKSWELRAAMSLARLLGSQHRRADAIACLEPVLEWFTEGLRTADLADAQALVSSLN
jgi:class 3 adenylate cyclase/predicted ATPase